MCTYITVHAAPARPGAEENWGTPTRVEGGDLLGSEGWGGPQNSEGWGDLLGSEGGRRVGELAFPADSPIFTAELAFPNFLADERLTLAG